MNNQLPMKMNGASAIKNSVPNDTVGVSSEKLDESQLNTTLFKYVAGVNQQTPEAEKKEKEPAKQRARFQATSKTQVKQVFKEEQAPTPDGTVGKAQKLREQILTLSLNPSIYRKVTRVHQPGNVDFGEPHNTPA